MSYSILNCLKFIRRAGLHNSTTDNDKFQEEDATLKKCYLMSRIYSLHKMGNFEGEDIGQVTQLMNCTFAQILKSLKSCMFQTSSFFIRILGNCGNFGGS